MGLFDSPKIIVTHQQLKKALFGVNSLDQHQREIVYEALAKELDDGGITKEELIRVGKELRNKGLISEIDKDNLLHLDIS